MYTKEDKAFADAVTASVIQGIVSNDRLLKNVNKNYEHPDSDPEAWEGLAHAAVAIGVAAMKARKASWRTIPNAGS